MLEAVDAAISVWGKDRVGLHLAPRGDVYEGDSNPAETFGYVAQEMGKRWRIAFICARESQDDPRLGPALKKAFLAVSILRIQKLTKETGGQKSFGQRRG